jgi:hypothetical protein
VNRLEEEALALATAAVGEFGEVSLESPGVVRFGFETGQRAEFRMVSREKGKVHEADRMPILWILRRPTRAELEDLRVRGQSYVALTGAVRIQVPGILIDRTDIRLKAFAVRPSKRSAFSDRASLVPRWLFSQPPKTTCTLTNLATALEVSPSVASYAVRDLAERELVEVETGGRERRIRLLDHWALLTAWAREYSWKESLSISVQAPIGSPSRFLSRLVELPLPRYALTLQAGASLFLPHSPVEHVYLYVDVQNQERLSSLVRRLSWPSDKSGRVHLLKPYYRHSVWKGVRLHGEIPVVSDLQLMLDLWNHPVRGREQAELILEKHLHRLEGT